MPPKKSIKKKNDERPTGPITTDARFKHIHNDPRFLRPKKKDMKVAIDKRFSAMMHSKEFGSGPKVDKYGRRLEGNTAEKEMKRFYRIEDEEEEEYSDEENKSLEQLEKELAEDEGNLEDEVSDEEESSISKKTYDPMRGKGVISSSEESSSDEEEVEEEEKEEEEDDDKQPRIAEGEETRRLAAVNMDWDKIKAVDILKVMNTFKPANSVVKSVSIYPSEFGKERLAKEDMEGPPREIFRDRKQEDNESDEEEITEDSIVKNQVEEGDGAEFDQEALRNYQRERLRYYYAVIECDTAATAKAIYKACDGSEYESSANFFDLRYIPDDMTFDDEPKETATTAPENYKPTNFVTEALQHSKVKLTWDQDDPDRIQLTRREFTEDDLKDLDFDAYLASSSEDESEDESVDALREKYRKLLAGSNGGSAFDNKQGEADDDEEEGDMEISFTPGLSEKAGAAVQSRLNNEEEEHEETTIEKYMRKQREKRKARKEKRMNTQNAKAADDDSEVDEEMANDPYFKETLQEMEAEGMAATDGGKAKTGKKKNKKKSKEEREEQRRQRAELELLVDDDGKGEGFNMKEVLKREKMEKKGKKGKKGKKMDLAEDDFEIDVKDPRFAAVTESHHFAIDPTNPQFKKTKSMKKLLEARHQKMKDSKADTDTWSKESKAKVLDEKTGSKPKDGSLSKLVDSVKRKGALSQPKLGKRQKL
ncbi:pre-rRNA-processing protein esf1 [Apophysomyces ossiformis]|uniref:Pre-rRNA-processing protein esf1 n=1 Tax=Apophysomyces ossiformis TaxID=679940 RepID=A0A8H7ERL0_9FUNG|nr:pre-rRNA-processing protein esf1 [Apophysomyces ossiformis]